MPAARGVKRSASKSSATTSSTAPKNKKKRGVVLLEIPEAPKKRGRVVTCGQGDVGQLGLGEDVGETSKFKFVTALGDKIVDVCAGGMHTVALDSDGKVWTFGCNDEGALGRITASDTAEGTPTKVALPAPAVAISAGDSHTAALLKDGEVYAWGAFRDSHGSMGLVVRDREAKPCREPVALRLPEPAAGIASGGDHLAVLTTSGAVYTMGCGEQGQLGRLSQRSASRDARQGFSALLTPAKVTLKTSIARIWAGYHATFALDSSGKMYAWGLNNYGQLGITGEKRKTALFAPTECDAFSPDSAWLQVACGQHHSVALSAAGAVCTIGRCEYGRLGLGDRVGDAETLEPVPKLQNKKCVSIAAGTSNSFAVTDAGEVFAWGMGSEGQLGTGACSDAPQPQPAALPPADMPAATVAAGGQHAAVLLIDTTPQKEESPAPEQETEEQKTEDEPEEEAPEPEKKKARGTKRQRKVEQEDEVSSTSSAQPAEKPQKLNGGEKQETAMDVDETDNSQDKKEEEKVAPTEEKTESMDTDKQEPGTKPEPVTEEAKPETEAPPATPEVKENESTKPETIDTSSQETTDSETKSQETDKSETKDVEMTEKSELNGETVDKKVESELVAPLTTTA